MTDQSGYNIRNDEIEALLRRLANTLKGSMPEGWGFTLMLFNYGEGTKASDGMFYISTAQRDDMIKVMREFIARNTQ